MYEGEGCRTSRLTENAGDTLDLGSLEHDPVSLMSCNANRHV